ncbi:UDP-2,4-diacetamido-2,4,6-trideoxy-beta-L-altropyranose hydrolase [Tannerella forsythia]|uniref:UDP-2,4-diacetamido-2,4, 6-trideoxy-beta-L-altropyranose hydrolase n=1 Tax=Tannerella forsythia TaxID=28112 RepID=A0A1D3UJQ1_TANFO|nr:UDP-2,4-diacetamido-2,4,6-trideoxy-beta-L-altropyranose hydrolase [Tannerella forsythia]TPE17899.1 UDP-2,4-diacetamido-2,4,6-trideoxy-beta-L-altropyranose hydrolase [Tannerella forsythia]SCQ20303.1 UDP-2,4-diacetamido-2,4, 6-trideoxy-beta-L-altropyranose hydrolase [Tannerella forsythia]
MGKRQIIFRADAGKRIGYGHFVRTLALADMLKEEFECVFVTQDPTEYQKREVERICPLIGLPSDNSKFSLFLRMLSGKEIVVLDNYFYSTDYQKKIKSKGCKLVCIDDMHDKHYIADAVINHGLDNPKLFDVEPYTRLLLGLDWALIRKPFRCSGSIRDREKGHIAISFGGADWNNLTTKFSEKITNDCEIDRITAIVGDAFPFEKKLKKVGKVQIVKNLSAFQMADLFRKVEFVILPSSTVCIEALACKCPVIAGWYTKNQKEMYHSLLKNKRIVGLGFLNERTIHGLCNVSQIKRGDNDVKIWEIQDISKKYIHAFHGI